jgi:hypothetical protein
MAKLIVLLLLFGLLVCLAAAVAGYTYLPGYQFGHGIIFHILEYGKL